MIADRFTMELQYNLNVLTKQKEALTVYQPANAEELIEASKSISSIEYRMANYRMLMMDRIAYIITNGLEDMIL